MRLVDDDHVIETLSSDRANQPFDVRILPRTRRRRDDFGDVHAGQSALEDLAVDAVAISVQPAWRCVGLDPVSWTLSERRIRCPQWDHAKQADVRGDSSPTSSWPAPSDWSW